MSERTKGRILVVDDEPAALTLLERRLAMQGYDVATAEDGRVALAEIARRCPDLVVLDIMMPRLSGFDVIRDLRGRPETAHLPVVAISAHGRGLDRTVPERDRPNAFFPKPIDFPDLLGEVEALLGGNGPTTGTTAPERQRGALLTFVGAKGGVGTTTLATNVAISLARSHWPTIFVETACFHGTAATVLGLQPSRRLDSLPLEEPAALTPDVIAAALMPHPSGVRALFGPAGMQTPSADGLFALFEALRFMGRTVVVDLDGAVSPFGQVALRVADRICVITHPEPASVDRAEALIRTVEGWGVPPQNVQVVVNRPDPAMALLLQEIVHRTGKPVAFELPPVATAAYDSISRARPLIDHPEAESIRRSLDRLTSGLVKAAQPTAISA
jgi:CheY-like chemotaxis protein/MinD-like ATPase involved in chromosome partitioning or flagellar assembly